ncbi:MAG TPA: YceI family protein [Terriglobales bacterium]|nr:YceI family protein [Terriglobales bacterium]
MGNYPMRFLLKRRGSITAAICLWFAGVAAPAGAEQIILRCDAKQTAADFTLYDVLHTVQGSFQGTRCDIHFDPASAKVSGEIVFDATSGRSGSDGRDRKMHKDVLESGRYPEISFRPDRVDGKVSALGTLRVQVHGMFGIHGAEHELIAPVVVKLEGDHWEASAHFQVPYAKWGMKNPSVLFLRVGDVVDIDFRAAGSTVPFPGP